jgi:hypothetical protein
MGIQLNTHEFILGPPRMISGLPSFYHEQHIVRELPKLGYLIIIITKWCTDNYLYFGKSCTYVCMTV